MAYASSNFGAGKKAAQSQPSGKGGAGDFASKAGSVGCKGEPTSSMPGGKMTTKGNAKKLS